MKCELEKREKQSVGTALAEQLVEVRNAYSPDVDIYHDEEGHRYVFLVDLPGVSQGNINLEIDEQNTLLLKAKTSFEEPEGISFRQFRTGNYYRAFALRKDVDKFLL